MNIQKKILMGPIQKFKPKTYSPLKDNENDGVESLDNF